MNYSDWINIGIWGVGFLMGILLCLVTGFGSDKNK